MKRVCMLLGVLTWATVLARADGGKDIPGGLWSEFVPSEYTRNGAGMYVFVQHFETMLQKRVDGELHIYVDLKILGAMLEADAKKDGQVKNASNTKMPVINVAREKTYRDVFNLFCYATGASWTLDRKRLLIFKKEDILHADSPEANKGR